MRDRLDELRCRPTGWLSARRVELVREQRRLRVEELAVTLVLDERDALAENLAAQDGVSERTTREAKETARALEHLPRIADAAHSGRLSGEQLGHVAQLADESTDAEWAERAPQMAPVDLARAVRCQRKPTAADHQARRQARHLRMWWSDPTTKTGMLNLRGQLADLDGALFENTITELVDKMRPAKGQPWDSRAHRAADALVQLCRRAQDPCEGDDPTPKRAPKPLLVVEVPLSGPATIARIPLPDAVVEQLRANATIEPVLVDDHSAPLVVGRRFPGLSDKIARAVLLRDGHCRCGTCDIRYGLHIHHLVPRSWGGTDNPSNLAAVCTVIGHHQMLIPNGPWALVGNPNQPHGLRLVRYTDLTDHQARHYGLPPPSRTSP
jgi:5-methylcytosine-specific restriction endonuclease McrA